MSRFNTLRRARSTAIHSPVGSKHGPHNSSSNTLQACDLSADNISTSGQHGDESGSLGGGLDTRIAKKGSDGELCIIYFFLLVTTANEIFELLYNGFYANIILLHFSYK